MKLVENLTSRFGSVSGLGKAIAAGAAGAAVMAANTGKAIVSKASQAASHIPAPHYTEPKKNREVVEMKKSTLVALFVALAVVAGVLGALYVYVLRREKELDEYEQLLFSEDFNDDLPDDFADDEAEA